MVTKDTIGFILSELRKSFDTPGLSGGDLACLMLKDETVIPRFRQHIVDEAWFVYLKLCVLSSMERTIELDNEVQLFINGKKGLCSDPQ